MTDEVLCETKNRIASRIPVQVADVWGLRVAWFGAAVLASAAVMFLNPKALGLVMLLLFVFGLVHGSLRYGWKNILIFLMLAVAVSNVLEDISVEWGWPFGHYHWTAAVKIIHLPPAIGPVYFALGYSSWMVASILLGEADKRLNKREALFSLPIVAALVMSMYDLCIDPMGSTVERSWIWHNGGGYFGVPLTNFLGWILTTWIFFQLFALIMSRMKPGTVREMHTPSFFLAPLLGYVGMALAVVARAAAIAGSDTVVTDLAGATWPVASIAEGSLTTVVFTMFFVIILASHRLANRERPARPTI